MTHANTRWRRWRPRVIKWQQYPSASMLAGYISIPNFMIFLARVLSSNADKSENVVNKMDGRKIIPISLNGSRIFPKWFGHNTQTQAHVQVNGRMNTWNGKNTISINVGWWLDIRIHQHAKFYAIFSKWFVSETARPSRGYKTVEIK